MNRKNLTVEEKLIAGLEFRELCAETGPREKLSEEAIRFLEKELVNQACKKEKKYTEAQRMYVLSLFEDFGVPEKYYEKGIPDGIVSYSSLLTWKDNIILQVLSEN